MVNRSRLQSQEQPRRLSWLIIGPPDSAFHCQTRSMKASRPKVVAILPLGGQHPLHDILGGDAGMVGARHPQGIVALHRLQRTRISWRVLFRACPMCSEPVTFGGGMTML